MSRKLNPDKESKYYSTQDFPESFEIFSNKSEPVRIVANTNRQRILDNADLEIVKEIGKVPSGIVYLAKDIDSTEEYALMILDVSNESEDKITSILSEIYLAIDSCNEFSKYVVCYYDAKLIEKEIYIVSEYISGGQIEDYVSVFSEPLCIWPVMLQTLLGLAHIHNSQYVHGNINLNSVITTKNLVVKYTNMDFIRKVDCLQSTINDFEQTRANDVWGLISILYKLTKGKELKYTISKDCIPKSSASVSYSRDDGRTKQFIENIIKNYTTNLTVEIILATFVRDVLSPPLNFNWSVKIDPPLTEKQGKVNKFDIIKLIGSGSFGSIYLATNASGEKIALKTVNITKFSGKDHEFLKEASILEDLSSDHIAKYYESFFSGNHFFIVSEYISGDDLETFISNTGSPLPPDSLWPMIFQLLNGLSYIHEAGYAHRDIKPENVMITGKGMIKYIDFGLSCIQKCKVENCKYECTNKSGTSIYLSPEYLTTQPEDHYEFEKAHDMWSLMLTIFFFVNRFTTGPFKDFDNNLKGKELHREFSRLTQNGMSKSRYSLDDGRTDTFVNSHLIVDPKTRPTIQTTLSDFVNNILSKPYLCW